MRLAPGILAFAMLVGPAICDSVYVARADEARPVPYIHPDWLMRELRPLTMKTDRRYALGELNPQMEYEPRQAQPELNPQVIRERQRVLRRGDFWTTQERKRLFP